MRFRRNPNAALEARLRSERPVPKSDVVDMIVGSVERTSPTIRPRSLRIAFAVASVGILAALAALGGVSYAASGVQHAAVAVKHVFVSNPKGESKQAGPFDVLGSLRPAKTSAGDQYLPPGVTPAQALANFIAYVVSANRDRHGARSCAILRGAARAACLAEKKALQAQLQSLQRRLRLVEAKVGGLSPAATVKVATLLSIHLQQEQALAAAQTQRRADCADAAYKQAHPAVCAKANPYYEAVERLKLGVLELAELEALLGTL